MNKKGFMMAELVVVSSVVVVTLTVLYASFNKIMASYDEILNYNDVGTTYRLGYYIRTNSIYNDALLDENFKEINLGQEEINKVEYKDNLYVCKVSTLQNLKKEKINQTFKDYITYVSENVSKEIKAVALLESCQTKKNSNNTTCKYAYLEVENAPK